MDDDRDKKARALSAAFLKSQVESLEASVAQLSVPTKTLFDPKHSSPAVSPSVSPIPAPKVLPTTAVVLHVSVLVHALPVVRQWLRTGSHFIYIPLAALSSLDLLKKSNTTMANLAREATRFLDQILSRSDAKNKLYSMQKEGEAAVWEDLLPLFSEEPDKESSKTPRHIRSLLQFYSYLSNTLDPIPKIAYYIPPLDISELQDEKASGESVLEWVPLFYNDTLLPITEGDIANATEHAKHWNSRRDKRSNSKGNTVTKPKPKKEEPKPQPMFIIKKRDPTESK